MFKKAKRWIAFLLSLILVLQFQVPIVARAATVTKTVYGADCTYDSSTGTLTVTGEFRGTQRAARECADGYGPYSYFQGWFDGPIRKIVCKNLTLTTEYAAEGMFSKLQDLEEVVFENVTAHKPRSMYLMFYNCPNLTSVDLSGLKTGTYDTSEVDTFERMFDDCRNLKYLNLGTTTSGLYINENVNVANMFRNCKPLRIEAPFFCQPIIPLSGTYSLPNGSQVEWLGASAVRTTLKLVGAVDPDDPDPDDPDDPDNPINKPFVTISGTPKMGETLSAYVTNGQGMGSLSYQWKRNHSPISGATSSTYSIVGADIAKLLTCQVTGSDGTVIEAGAYALVEKMDPYAKPSGLTAQPASSDSVADGAILGTTNKMEMSLNPDFSNRRYCSDNATTNLAAGTYYVRYAEDNYRKASETVVINVGSSSGTTLTGSVNISGSPYVEQTLRAIVQVSNSSAIPKYQWKKESATGTISNCLGTSTNASYRLTNADLGCYVFCVVTFTNFPDVTLTSATTPEIKKARMDAPDPNSLQVYKKPTEAGKADGIISGASRDMEYSLYSNFQVSTTVTASYVKGLKAGAYYFRYYETEEHAASEATVVIMPDGDMAELTGDISMSGEARYGNTLTVTLSNSNATGGNLVYKWTRGTTVVSNKASYKCQADDIGQKLTCTVSSNLFEGSKSITTSKVAKGYGPSEPAGITVQGTSKEGAKDGKILGVDTTMEYATTSGFSDAKSCTGSSITGLAAGTYYIRVKATDTKEAGSRLAVTVPEGSLPKLTGTLTIIGNLKYGQTLTASYTPGNGNANSLVFAWYRGSTKIGTGTTYKLQSADIGQQIKLTASSTSFSQGLSTTTSSTVTKADGPAAPSGLEVVDASAAGKKDGKILNVTTSMEYSTTTSFSDAITCTGTSITGLGAGIYYVRVKETTTTKAGSYKKVTIQDGPSSDLTGTLKISGSAKYGQTLTASYTPGNATASSLTFTWKRGSTKLGTGTTYKITADDIGSTITLTATGSGFETGLSVSTKTVSKADGPAAPSGLTITNPSGAGKKDGKISNVTTKMEYSTSSDFSNATTCSGTTITGLGAGTYYVRVKATSTTNAGAYEELTLTDGSKPALSGTLAISGSCKYGQTLTASYTPGNGSASSLTYTWKRGSTQVGTGTTYKITADDIGSTLTLTATGTSFSKGLSVTSGKVSKADAPPQPSGLETQSTSGSGKKDGKILNVTTKMEYSTTTDFASATACTSTTVTGLGAGTYYVRVKETSTTKASNYAIVTIKDGSNPALSGTLSISGSCKYGQTLTASYTPGNGNASSLTYTWKRGSTQVGMGTTYKITADDIGSTLTLTATGSSFSKGLSVTSQTISKADGPAAPSGLDVKKPSAKGKKDGQILNVTTKMEYSTSSDFSNATTCTGTTITGLGAGTYYVRVKATSTTKAGAVATITISEGDSPALSGTLTISGSFKYGQTLTASYTPGNGNASSLIYTWKRGNTQVGTGTTYKITADDIGSTLTLTASSASFSKGLSVTSQTISKADGPAAPDGLDVKRPSERGKKDGQILNVTTKMEYSTSSDFSNATTCTGTTITGLGAGTYYVRVKATSTTKAGKVASVTIKEGDNPALSGTLAISGSCKYGQTLTASYTPGNGSASSLTYTWKRGSTQVGTGTTYKITADDIGSTLTLTATGSSFSKGLSVTSQTISKADGPASPQGLEVKRPSEKGKKDGQILNVTTKMEYATTSNFSDAITCSGTSITGLGAGTYYVRVKATSTTKAGNPATITISEGDNPALSGTLKISGSCKYGQTLTASYTPGNGSAGSLTYIWKRGNNQVGTGTTYKIQAEDIGSTLTLTASSTSFSKGLSVTSGKIEKADGPNEPTGLSSKAPSAAGKKDGQILNVTTKMEYSTSSDFASATTCSGTSITGIGAGTYYVRVKETSTTKAGKAAKVVVKEGKATLSGQLSILGDYKYGQTLTADYSAGNAAASTLSYQWKRGSTVVSKASAYTLVKADIGQVITLTISSSACVGTLSVSTTKIDKADGPKAPSGLSVVAASSQGAADGKITGVKTTMEYSTSADFATKTACTSTTITKLKAGTYYVRVAETATENAGAFTMITVPDGNAALSGSLVLSGTTQYGKTLTATLSGSNNTGNLTYQWKRGSNVINGATGSSYKLVQADIGQKITCVVKSDVQTGSLSVTTSSAVIKAAAPAAPSGLNGVKASKKGAADGKITGVDKTMEYSTAANFSSKTACTSTTITGLKAGTYYVRVAETATTSAGAYATVKVADGPAALSGSVAIVGELKFGKTLKAVASTNNTGTLSYQWKRGSNVISGATGASYKLVQADIGSKITCVVTSSVETGSLSGSTSAVISKADGPAAPTSLVPVAASKQGAADGKITGVTTKMEYSTAANFSTKTACTSTSITKLKAGTYYVRIAETATTKAGVAATIKVADGNATLGGSLVISGTLKYGQTLTATLSNTNNSGTLKYQWKRGSNVINGATSATYKLVQADIGQKITCVVSSSVQTGSLSVTTATAVLKADGPATPTGLTATKTSKPGAADGKISGVTTKMEYSTTANFSTKTACTSTTITGLKAGTYYVRVAETATNLAGTYATVKVVDGVAALSGKAIVTGSPKYGQTLKVTLSNSNNTGKLTYQWMRGGSAISGATGASYKLVKEDVGQKITCVVKSSIETGSLTSTAVSVGKADGPAAPTTLVPVATSKQGAADGKIKGVTTSMEYSTGSSFSGAKTCTSTTITGLKAGTYYVRIKATATTNAGAYAIVKVAQGKAVLSGSVVILGYAKFGQYLKATVSGSNNTGKLSYQWMRGNTKIDGATKSDYKLVKADIGQMISCVITSSVQNGSIQSTPMKIAKADGPNAPTGLTGVNVTAKGMADGKIEGVTTSMEYSTTSDFSSNVKNCTSTTITGLKPGTYYVRVKATSTTKAGKVTKIVITENENKSVTKIFKDVKAGQWYVGAVQFVYDNKYMNGTSKTTFEPMTNLTRGQFITVLYNLEGKPNTTFKNIFSDVKESDFFGPAVVWASTKNIVKGIGNGKFGPNQQITREELATMLYNYASYKKYSLQIDSYVLDKFADAGKVQSWAHKPVEWAVTQGVINGKGKNASGMDVLDPQGKATRAECAQMIKNLVEKVINKKK